MKLFLRVTNFTGENCLVNFSEIQFIRESNEREKKDGYDVVMWLVADTKPLRLTTNFNEILKQMEKL